MVGGGSGVPRVGLVSLAHRGVLFLDEAPEFDANALDALHTQDQTARELVLEHGADYLLSVKDNQPTLRASIEKLVPVPPADFSPSLRLGHAGRSA